MSEVEELRKEVATLRAELDEWKAHIVKATGLSNRAIGHSQGVGEMVKLRLDGIEGRLRAIEGGPCASLQVSPYKIDPKDITWIDI